MIEDRTSAGENLMSAPLTAKRFSAGDVMILGIDNTALFAGYTVGVLMLEQPFKTSLIIGVLGLHVG